MRNQPTKPKGARAIAFRIGLLTDDGEDLVNWCMALWRDVDAPLEWRWKAFEWLSNRFAGGTPTMQVLNVTNNINSSRDLRALSDDALERIDAEFKAANKKMIEAKGSES